MVDSVERGAVWDGPLLMAGGWVETGLDDIDMPEVGIKQEEFAKFELLLESYAHGDIETFVESSSKAPYIESTFMAVG